MMVAPAVGDPPFRPNTSASPSLIPSEDEEPFYLINCNYPFSFCNKNSPGTQTYAANHVTKTLSQCPTAAARQHDDPNQSAIPMTTLHSVLSANDADEGFKAILMTPHHYLWGRCSNHYAKTKKATTHSPHCHSYATHHHALLIWTPPALLPKAQPPYPSLSTLNDIQTHKLINVEAIQQ